MLIGYDIQETLQFEPPQLWVLELRIPKFACQDQPECGVAEPSRPVGLVEGNRYDTSVAAEIITGKYGYHLPIYRQQDWFAGSGWTPSRSTLLNIQSAAAPLIKQELTRERMADARAALKCKGRRVAGRVPFGYVADRATKQLAVRPDEADLVRRMFEMAASGKRPQEIAAIANSEHWEHTGRISQWTARLILKMLSNPIYAGNIRDRERTVRGCHPPIITSALFEQARHQIQSRRSRKPGRTSAEDNWPLRKLIKCGQCGRAMIPSISGYRNFLYRYYRCRSDADGRRPCRDVSVPAFQIEELCVAPWPASILKEMCRTQI